MRMRILGGNTSAVSHRKNKSKHNTILKNSPLRSFFHFIPYIESVILLYVLYCNYVCIGWVYFFTFRG